MAFNPILIPNTTSNICPNDLNLRIFLLFASDGITSNLAVIEYVLFFFSLIYRTLDTGWSWVVLFATFMSFVVLGGSVYTTGIDHTILLERFNESNATTAWAASLFSALSSLAGKISLLRPLFTGERTFNAVITCK